MARPIHHFLKEFASDETPFQPPLPKPVVVLEKAAPAPDAIASRLQAAFQEGLAAGRAMEREATEAQAAELAVDFDRRIGEVGATFSTVLADSLAVELRAGIEAASARISSNVATALVPFLREGITRAAIASFVKELGDVLDTTDGMLVEVACPKEILEPLRDRLEEVMTARGAPPGSVRFVSGSATEIRVTLNDTVIETRLAEWLSRLDEVLR